MSFLRSSSHSAGVNAALPTSTPAMQTYPYALSTVSSNGAVLPFYVAPPRANYPDAHTQYYMTDYDRAAAMFMVR
jgi:hypothetical protein